MNKKIELSYKGVDYTLEYNRDAILYMEKNGLVASEIVDKPLTSVNLLWKGAFYKNHKKADKEIIDEIYEGIKDKTALTEALSQMYLEAYSILIGDSNDEDDSKKIEWKMS